MKYISLFTLFLVLFVLNVKGQVSYYEGQPFEIKKLLPDEIPLQKPQFSFSLQTPHQPQNPHPSRYGTPELINLSATNPGKLKTWTVTVESKSAVSIDLTLSKLNISPAGKIYIYNENMSQVMGPITPSDVNGSDRSISTLPFKNNKIYIYIIEGEIGSTSFVISNIVHGFRDLANPFAASTPLQNARTEAVSSTACIPSVACMVGFEQEIEAVGLITVNGYIGTGTFLNNENQDRRPFFLTAFHVVDGNDDGLLSGAEYLGVGSATVLIDFRLVSCGGAVNIGTTLGGGGSVRAAWKNTDFALIELNATPHIRNRVNFAGWSRSGSTPSNVVALHHPDGVHMRYSHSGGASVRVFPVNWKFFEVTSWAIGATKGGSSGGALFNQDKKVVGQLAGGLSGCATLLPDIYGRFYDSWDGGGTSSTQLKHWLSPSNNLSSMDLLEPLKFINTSYLVCYGSNTTITLPHVLPGETASWTVSSGVSIVSSTYNSVTVTASSPTASGGAAITATFGAESIIKSVWVGKPASFSIMYQDSASGWTPVSSSNMIQPGLLEMNATFATGDPALIANISWNSSPSGVVGGGQYARTAYTNLWSGQSMSFSPAASNTCGSTSHFSFSFTVPSFLLIYPNPATSTISISTESKSNFLDSVEIIELLSTDTKSPPIIYFSKGVAYKGSLVNSNRVTLDIGDLPIGVYFIRVSLKNVKKPEVYKFVKV